MKNKNIIRNSVINAPVTQKIYNFRYLTIAITIFYIIIIIYFYWICKSSGSSGSYWLTESTGRIHKQGCVYYGKTKGRIVAGKKNYLPCKKCFGIENGSVK